MSDFPDHTFGRYHLLEQLGRGGMATVYKAYDTRLERDVAVKIIRRSAFPLEQLERILKRFEREAKALARLTHPNIVPLIDYGEQEGAPYLVMPYLPGGTLKQKLGKPMPWLEALRLLLPVARALEYAHQRNIIHRDVKPSNILLTESRAPMLADFGIAKILDLEDGQTLTVTGVGIGTPEYMSPEQGLGKSVDARADIYSLGVVLYELVAGRKPFQADTPLAVLLKQATEPLPRPTSFAPDLPQVIEKLLLKALAKDPADRYGDMAELAAAMEKAIVGSPSSVIGQAPLAVPSFQSAIANPQPAVLQSDDAVTVDQGFIGENFAEGVLTVLQEGTLSKHLTCSALQDEIVLWLAPGVTMALVRVPAGPFLMGSPEGEGDADERPMHQVYLNEYWIGKTPVTNRQYEAFVRASGYKAPRHWKEGLIPEGQEQHPVVYVSWYDARAFCDWLSQASGEKIRLPGEAEWEKAARGTDGRRYPWGNEMASKALGNRAHGLSARGAKPVGQYSPEGDSPYGCADMAENVWEWVNSLYKPYPYTPKDGREGRDTPGMRVVRGGSWNFIEHGVRVALRLKGDPGNQNNLLGFRCARSR